MDIFCTTAFCLKVATSCVESSNQLCVMELVSFGSSRTDGTPHNAMAASTSTTKCRLDVRVATRDHRARPSERTEPEPSPCLLRADAPGMPPRENAVYRLNMLEGLPRSVRRGCSGQRPQTNSGIGIAIPVPASSQAPGPERSLVQTMELPKVKPAGLDMLQRRSSFADCMPERYD